MIMYMFLKCTTTDKLCTVCTTHEGLQGAFMSLKALCVVHTTHSLSVVVISLKELSITNVDNYMLFNLKKYICCIRKIICSLRFSNQ